MKRVVNKTSQGRTRPPAKLSSLEEWDQSWKKYWNKARTSGYELPVQGPAGAEAAFLTEARTREKED